MSIQLFKDNTTSESDMDSFKKNLRMHRLRIAGIAAGAVAAAALCFWGISVSVENRVFEIYEVTESYERSDAIMTQYAEYRNYVLKYGTDGISCVDSENRPIWSQTYNMQHPMIYICEGSIVVAEESGTEVMIFDETGYQGTVQTLLPVRQIAVSSQGVLAVLLEDGDIMRLKFYDKKGEELVDSKFELQDTGYPLRMSISADGTKLAVAFLQVQDGSVNTSLAFYNFDSVGENHNDRMVAARTMAGMVMQSVHYVDDTHCFAVGAGQLLLYEGKQIPESIAEISFDRKICSVFYSGQYIGLVLEGTEQPYALQVYDTQGKLEFETEFDMDYQSLKFSGNNILIYNEFECMMLNHNGKVFFTGTFDESISNLYTLSGHDRYVVMHASKTDRIHLR